MSAIEQSAAQHLKVLLSTSYDIALRIGYQDSHIRSDGDWRGEAATQGFGDFLDCEMLFVQRCCRHAGAFSELRIGKKPAGFRNESISCRCRNNPYRLRF